MSELPDPVRRFVLTCIPSVPHLEALLYFRRAAPAARQPAEAARELYLSEPRAREVVDDLVACGMLERDAEGAARLQPRDAEMTAAIEGVAAAYHADLIGLTHLIHDSVQRSAQRFADAFKLRKDS